MTEKPFHSGPPPSGERSSNEKSSTTVSGVAILWHAIHMGLACAVFIFTPLFLAPVCLEIYEEFGIDLPKVSQLFLAWSDMLIKTMILLVPPIVATLLSIEFGLYYLSPEKGKRPLSLLWWLILIFALIFVLVAILLPLAPIVTSLSA